MSRLLHSLKHCHARLMVMTRVCACDANFCVHVCVCVSARVLMHTLWMHLLPAPPSRVIGRGKWEAFASQPPIPRNRSWMARSSDRRQSELALTVGANERGLALWLCEEGAETRQYKHAQLSLTHCTHARAGNGWAIWIALAFRRGGNVKVFNKILQVSSMATQYLVSVPSWVKYLQNALNCVHWPHPVIFDWLECKQQCNNAHRHHSPT